MVFFVIFCVSSFSHNHGSGKPSVPFFRQQWLVLGVKLMEINSILFSREVEKIAIFER